MEGWKWFLIWLMPVLGVVIASILGWRKKKGEAWDWDRFIWTVVAGVGAGGLWMWIVNDISAIHLAGYGRVTGNAFCAGSLVGGLPIGIGIDFLVKKLPIPP